MFFFGDYQATRTTQGIETGNIPVPSLAERGGQLLRHRRSADGQRQRIDTGRTCCRSGSATACRAGEPYYTPGCSTRAQCVFPNAVDSGARMVGAGAAAAAVHARRRTPAPSTLSTGAFAQTVRDDKGSFRVDGNTPVRAADRLLLPRRLPPRQSVSGPAGRRQRAGLRRADARTRAALVVRQRQDVRPRTP